MDYNWEKLHNRIMEYFALRTFPVVFKYYENADEMLANKKLERTTKGRRPCTLVGKAAYRGTCMCMTSDQVCEDYCRAVNCMAEKDQAYFDGADEWEGRFYANKTAARDHHAAIIRSEKVYQGFAAAPLKAGVIEDPDGCIMHMTPEQLFWLCAHSQHETYKKLNFSCVGESTCSDSVLRTLLHGEIGVGLGGYGERAFGSLAHTELVVSLTIKDLEDVLRGAENMRHHSRFDRSQPIPALALDQDLSEVMAGDNDDFAERPWSPSDTV